jgi:hypothetical protein
MRKPTPEEIAEVKAEGHRLGWLRSRMMKQPWPREGISACGRPGCPVCDAAARETVLAKRKLETTR